MKSGFVILWQELFVSCFILLSWNTLGRPEKTKTICDVQTCRNRSVSVNRSIAIVRWKAGDLSEAQRTTWMIRYVSFLSYVHTGFWPNAIWPRTVLTQRFGKYWNKYGAKICRKLNDLNTCVHSGGYSMVATADSINYQSNFCMFGFKKWVIHQRPPLRNYFSHKKFV